MKAIRSIFGACRRKDRSLNTKRENPYVDQLSMDEYKTKEIEEIALTESCEVPSGVYETLVIKTAKGDELDPLADNAHEVGTDAGSHDDKVEKEPSLTSPRAAREDKIRKIGEIVNDGEDGQVNFSSDDHDDEDLEGDGESIVKKRKLTKVEKEGKEEDEITQSWNNDMKQIRKNLTRINHLFEVYDGYKRKRNPLQISSDLIIQEPLKTDTPIKNDKKSDLTSQNAPKSIIKRAITMGPKIQSAPLRKEPVSQLNITEVSLNKIVPAHNAIEIEVNK